MSKYTSYVLYLLISIFVALLYVNSFGPLANLQLSINGLLCQFNAFESSPENVVLVTIDGRAQDEYGGWPWNHALIGDLLAATASGEPKCIVAAIDFSENAKQISAGYHL